MMIFWAVIVVQAVFSGILASILADKKGYSEGAWFAAGLFLGVFGLIAAAGLPDIYAREERYALVSAASRTCPDCAEPIRARAKVCKYCGHVFTDEDLIADAVGVLNSADEDARVNAIRVLCEVGGHEVASHLAETLSNCPPEVDIEVADKLRSLGARSTVPALLEALVSVFAPTEDIDRREELVMAYCDALAELADASIGEFLVQVLDRDASLDSRVRVIELLGSLRATEQIPELLATAESNEILRTQVLQAIKASGRDAIPVLQRELEKVGRRKRKMIQGLLDELAGGNN